MACASRLSGTVIALAIGMTRLLLVTLLLGSAGCFLSHGRDARPDAPSGVRDAGPLPLDAPALIDAPGLTDTPPIADAPLDAPPPPCPSFPPRPPASDPSMLLVWQQEVLVGQWRGRRTSPWDGEQEVELSFRADGRYDARCLVGDCTPLYWGDPVIVGAEYRLRDVTAGGAGYGVLVPLFGGVPAWEGALEDLVIDDAGQSLSMLFFRDGSDGGHGPLVYSLSRWCH